jgi:hyperosmotically inducible protein
MVVDERVASNDIHVDTVDGRITLFGHVNAEGQKQTAEAIARAVPAEKGVRNLLRVVASSNEASVDETDDLIRHRVESALERDPALVDSEVSVQSVDNGSVLLAGTAKTLSADLSALETTAAVPGVHGVASEMKAPDHLTDSELSRAAAGPDDSASDSCITAHVKRRLLADGDVPALEVSVDTDRGVVSLFGVVPSEKAKRAAVADAGKDDQVVSVIDDLQVDRAGGHRVAEARGSVAKRKVEPLRCDPRRKRADVEGKNVRARLTGGLASRWDRLHVAFSAHGTRGFRPADKDLRHRQSQRLAIDGEDDQENIQ